jgi:lysozyme
MYYGGLFQFNHPPTERFPVRGVDVSHHQKHISWFQASLDNVQFAYLKATEGSDFRDRHFAYNWEQRRKNNIPRGAYHFFNPCVSGAAQARNFLATVPVESGTLPPVLDLESSGNCRRSISRDEMRREVARFVSVLSERYAGPPVFYITPEYYKRYFEGHEREFPKFRPWIRNVIKEPSQKPCSEWLFWQYADHARVEGMRGPIDLNVFCGSAEEFNHLLMG